jgi:hypothetical protein
MRLYFLVESTAGEARQLTAGGRSWRLSAHDLDASADPDFACISYSWGDGREPSPLKPGFSVSDRTVPVLETFIRHRPTCRRIWVDAFCVPHEPRERAATLESMGYIYSRAREVVIVLSAAALPALAHMAGHDRVREEHLAVLENEEWVSRAWTYQEAANSRRLHITCERAQNTLIDGVHFLSAVGYTLSRMDGSHVSKARRFPRLDTFEDLIADYFMADYEQRSALAIMANMDRRTQRDAADHFYAMIGAISTERASAAGSADACEAFMAVCERKGDYSFIYSGAPREDAPGRRWRPRSGDVPALLSRVCWGASQPGEADARGLRLDGMVELFTGHLGDNAERSVRKWLAILEESPAKDTDASLHEALFRALQPIGFRGSSRCIDTPAGCFFPFETVVLERVVRVVVTTTVKWAFGGPGMACYEGEDGPGTCYTPGVFVGIIDEAVACSVRLD